MVPTKYKARYNRVWRKIGTEKLLENEIEIKNGESISLYEEIKPEKKTAVEGKKEPDIKPDK